MSKKKRESEKDVSQRIKRKLAELPDLVQVKRRSIPLYEGKSPAKIRCYRVHTEDEIQQALDMSYSGRYKNIQ